MEMYLHGYEDYEICSSVSCPKNFFEDGQKINATKNFDVVVINCKNCNYNYNASRFKAFFFLLLKENF